MDIIEATKESETAFLRANFKSKVCNYQYRG